MSALPPSYNQAMGHGGHNTGTFFSYVDFAPNCLKPGGFMSLPTYERFSVLMQRANEWLRSNPQFIVSTCESIESRASYGQVLPNTMVSSHIETGKQGNCYHRSLRLWIAMRGPSDPPEPQQLGMFNVVPACIKEGGFLSQPVFESFDVTLDKVNGMFRQNPLPGRILTLETQEMKFETWGNTVDPEGCFWWESGKAATFFLMIIRIFYVSGPPANEQIGCVDFVPNCTSAGGVFTPSSYEPLANVAAKANRYMRENPHLSITNVQTLDYKVSRSNPGTVNSMRSLYHEYGRGTTAYLRILRVYFANSVDGSGPQRPTPNFAYRTFAPATLVAGGTFSAPQFESQPDNMKRVQAWVNYTGARVIGAETVTVRMYSGGQYGNSEVTGTYNMGNMAEIIVFMIRIFLDGSYAEPPPEVMPPMPQVQEATGCCTLL